MKFFRRLLLCLAALCAGSTMGPILITQATHDPLGNQRQEEYRAPWPERILFERDGGWPIFATCGPTENCGGHAGKNAWAIDLYARDRPGSPAVIAPRTTGRSAIVRPAMRHARHNPA